MNVQPDPTDRGRPPYWHQPPQSAKLQHHGPERACICTFDLRNGAVAVIEINPTVGISEHELSFSFERSPGPGGQNVNKVNTRVTLHFDVLKSTSLSTQQKLQVRKMLGSRINHEGVLKIISSKERTQLANRRAAVNRFISLMGDAFHIPKPRKKTTVPLSAQKKRVENKLQRGAIKRVRQASVPWNGD